MTSDTAANWRDALLPEGGTIEQAIRCLNDASLQIVLVTNKKGELVGTITDGDIRRGLLRGLSVQSLTDDIVFRNPLVAPPEMRGDAVAHLMRANRIHQLPVVDEHRHVVGLHLWDDIAAPAERSNLMVIMAGGLGSRMQSHTENCPKPLLPVAGKPMLEHIIERAKADGFTRFVLAVRYLGHMIEEHFRDGARWGVQIDYLREDDPLGTAGALFNLSPRPELPFIVTNGDVLTDIHYGELLDFHVRIKAAATMAVRMYEWQHPFGVVQINGVEITGFEEKPVHRTHVNAGVYVLNPSTLNCLRAKERIDMPTLFENVRLTGERAVVYPMHEPWLDVGRPGDFDEAYRAVARSTARKE